MYTTLRSNRSRRSWLTALTLALTTALLLPACADDPASESAGEFSEDDWEPEPEDEANGEAALAVLEGARPGLVVIVEYVEGADVDATTDKLRDTYGLEVTSRYREAFPGAAFIAPDQATVDALAADSSVLELEPDELRDILVGDQVGGSNDTPPDDVQPAAQRGSTGWHMINGAAADNEGGGIRVAVIDTGVDLDHRDLKAGISGGKNCISGKKKPDDGQGHGTHVAGIIAARHNNRGVVGVAPAARIVPVKVFDDRGKATRSSILCGIEFVARHHKSIRVANMSLAGPCGDDCRNTRDSRAVRLAVRRGVTVVAATSNDLVEAGDWFPGALSEVIAVSMYVDSDANGRVNRGDVFDPCGFGPEIDITAPGGDINSTFPGGKYGLNSGTSMATPHVAGAAAVYLKFRPSSSPADVREGLRAFARRVIPGRSTRHPEPLLDMNWLTNRPTSETGCGDGECTGAENDSSCPQDCGCNVEETCTTSAPYGCYCDADCAEEGDCCADACDVCGRC
ncbi:MAG TPA: S8 family serine peptidase [Kofleriaceae bacterium]|nr:S8 family serine peptidase [Kofleriaceae bacterium]